MITLPAGFDGVAFVAELFGIAAPFVGISFLIAAGILINNYFRSIKFH